MLDSPFHEFLLSLIHISKVRELTEEICAFANADGGYLLIGVDDNGQVVDTNLENDKRSAIQGSM